MLTFLHGSLGVAVVNKFRKAFKKSFEKFKKSCEKLKKKFRKKGLKG